MPTYNGKWESAEARFQRIRDLDRRDRSLHFDRFWLYAMKLTEETGLDKVPGFGSTEPSEFYNRVIARMHHEGVYHRDPGDDSVFEPEE